MDLQLTMLMQNTALRLYKVSKESQLLRHLRGNCLELRKTLLTGTAGLNEYQNKQTGITPRLPREGQLVTIYCEGTVSNNLHEDGKQVGATSAVLYCKGQEWNHKEEVYGEIVTSNDTAIHSILPTLDILADFLMSHQTTAQQNFLVLTPSTPVISKALDASPYDKQLVALECL
ncbi:hypothetical protein BJV74DRAFT_795655 [Russula compacta]|nr:hypothetical protein BJV74DRAFT_795655 [Russula compacta]